MGLCFLTHFHLFVSFDEIGRKEIVNEKRYAVSTYIKVKGMLSADKQKTGKTKTQLAGVYKVCYGFKTIYYVDKAMSFFYFYS